MTHHPDSPASDVVAQAAALLRSRGERMTHPRRSVLEALAAHPGHWTAEDVAGLVAGADARVHRSSVYRCLETLTHLGVVQHVHLGHGTTVYHLADAGPAHVHAQCRACGRLVDLPASLLDGVTVLVRQGWGFELDPSHTALSGLCSDCAPDADRHSTHRDAVPNPSHGHGEGEAPPR